MSHAPLATPLLLGESPKRVLTTTTTIGSGCIAPPAALSVPNRRRSNSESGGTSSIIASFSFSPRHLRGRSVSPGRSATTTSLTTLSQAATSTHSYALCGAAGWQLEEHEPELLLELTTKASQQFANLEYELALDSYRGALQLYLKQEQVETRTSEKVVAMCNAAHCWRNMGTIYRCLNQYREASKHWKKAEKLYQQCLLHVQVLRNDNVDAANDESKYPEKDDVKEECCIDNMLLETIQSRAILHFKFQNKLDSAIKCHQQIIRYLVSLHRAKQQSEHLEDGEHKSSSSIENQQLRPIVLEGVRFVSLPDQKFRDYLIVSLELLGNLYKTTAAVENEEEVKYESNDMDIFEVATQLLQQQCERDPNDETSALSLVHILKSLYFTYCERAELDCAVVILHRIVDFQLSRKAKISNELYEAMDHMGSTFEQMEDYDKAINCYEKALLTRSQCLGNTHMDVAQSLVNVARCLELQGNSEGSMDLYRAAQTIYAQQVTSEEFDVEIDDAAVLLELVPDMLDQQRYEEAVSYLCKCLAVAEEEKATSDFDFDKDHDDNDKHGLDKSRIYYDLGRAYFGLRDFVSATICLLEAARAEGSVSEEQVFELLHHVELHQQQQQEFQREQQKHRRRRPSIDLSSTSSTSPEHSLGSRDNHRALPRRPRSNKVVQETAIQCRAPAQTPRSGIKTRVDSIEDTIPILPLVGNIRTHALIDTDDAGGQEQGKTPADNNFVMKKMTNPQRPWTADFDSSTPATSEVHSSAGGSGAGGGGSDYDDGIVRIVSTAASSTKSSHPSAKDDLPANVFAKQDVAGVNKDPAAPFVLDDGEYLSDIERPSDSVDSAHAGENEGLKQQHKGSGRDPPKMKPFDKQSKRLRSRTESDPCAVEPSKKSKNHRRKRRELKVSTSCSKSSEKRGFAIGNLFVSSSSSSSPRDNKSPSSRSPAKSVGFRRKSSPLGSPSSDAKEGESPRRRKMKQQNQQRKSLFSRTRREAFRTLTSEAPATDGKKQDEKNLNVTEDANAKMIVDQVSPNAPPPPPPPPPPPSGAFGQSVVNSPIEYVTFRSGSWDSTVSQITMQFDEPTESNNSGSPEANSTTETNKNMSTQEWWWGVTAEGFGRWFPSSYVSQAITAAEGFLSAKSIHAQHQRVGGEAKNDSGNSAGIPKTRTPFHLIDTDEEESLLDASLDESLDIGDHPSNVGVTNSKATRRVTERPPHLVEDGLQPVPSKFGSIFSGSSPRRKQEKDLANEITRWSQRLHRHRSELGPNHSNVAIALFTLAVLHSRTNALSTAMEMATEALRIQKLNADHVDAAQSLHFLADLHLLQKQYKSALTLYTEAMQVERLFAGYYSDTTAKSLNCIGTVRSMQSEFALAMESHQEALHILKHCHGENLKNPLVSQTLCHIGSVYYRERNAPASISKSDNKAKKNDYSTFVEGGMLEVIGRAHEERGSYKLAIAFFEEKLQYLENRDRGPMDLEEAATTLNSLGMLSARAGLFTEAIDYYERALSLQLQVGCDDVQLATVRVLSAAVHCPMGNWSTALQLLLDALAVLERELGMEHQTVAATLYHVGVVRLALCEYDEALEALNRAFGIQKTLLGPEHPATLRTRRELGNLYAVYDADLDAALEIFESVLEIQQSIHGERHPNIADTIHCIGCVYSRKQDYPQALRALEECYYMRIEFLGCDHPLQATTLHEIAKIHMDRGRYQKALHILDVVLGIREESLGEGHVDVGRTLVSKVRCHVALGDTETASPLLEKAMTRTKKAVCGEGHPAIAEIYVEQGMLNLRRCKFVEAKLSVQHAIDLMRGLNLEEDHPIYYSALEKLERVKRDEMLCV